MIATRSPSFLTTHYASPSSMALSAACDIIPPPGGIMRPSQHGSFYENIKRSYADYENIIRQGHDTTMDTFEKDQMKQWQFTVEWDNRYEWEPN